ncbi:hypothetical protein [Micromonospora sp. S4605]|nr:hypothetical protein [Micromonospora sp. S4605]
MAQLLRSLAQWRIPSQAVELLPVLVADGQYGDPLPGGGGSPAAI